MTEYYAHTPGADKRWHPLAEHLLGVAELARQFAEPFGGGDVAYWLGLWHDLGKYSPQFQEYLRACAGGGKGPAHGPDHKAAGARLAVQRLGTVALALQGHHGGLQSPAAFKAWLADPRRADRAGLLDLARQEVRQLEPDREAALPPWVARDPLAAELWLRFVFSALVDADFLDTERHMDPRRGESRPLPLALDTLWARLERAQGEFGAAGTDDVSRVRRRVYDACLTAAEQPPGLFRLAAPTGSGKTRSGMAFALRHALRNGQERVIVAVPFISITEQTADIYRRVLGEDAILEHHSGMGDANDERSDDPARLAAENWDAPIIVTTTVQLFESLFAAATSRCRKLHNLACSVIILDEVQALPLPRLSPILDVLRHLCAHYGATVVLSTATQPAFEEIPSFAGLPATDIVPDPARLFAAPPRVRYEWQPGRAWSWEEVASAMRDNLQALAVLNTKKDALALLDALDDPAALHLSTLLCGAHRRAVIAEVKRRLAAGERCRLISTQVVEAGVDLDFPLVVRALGPLDAMIQAAGRCNREGRLEHGRVVVFDPAEGGIAPGVYKGGREIARALLDQPDPDLDAPGLAHSYFRQLYGTFGADRDNIQILRQSMDYGEVARRFHLIDDASESVVVPYGDPDERAAVAMALARLRDGAPEGRRLLRVLQPYLVSVRFREAERLRREGFIAPICTGLGEWLGKYHAVRGIVAERMDPEQLVI